jgi:hypothetical protein
VATIDDAMDYAVINSDPAKVNAVADFDGFGIDGIGPDPGFYSRPAHSAPSHLWRR